MTSNHNKNLVSEELFIDALSLISLIHAFTIPIRHLMYVKNFPGMKTVPSMIPLLN